MTRRSMRLPKIPENRWDQWEEDQAAKTVVRVVRENVPGGRWDSHPRNLFIRGAAYEICHTAAQLGLAVGEASLATVRPLYNVRDIPLARCISNRRWHRVHLETLALIGVHRG